MKELNKWQNLVFQVGGVLMVIGAAAPIFFQAHAGALMLLVGAMMFGTMQMLAKYEGRNVTLRRLRRQQIMADFFLIFSGFLAVTYEWGVAQAYGFHISNGEWKLAFIIGVVLEIYTVFRIDYILKKEKED